MKREMKKSAFASNQSMDILCLPGIEVLAVCVEQGVFQTHWRKNVLRYPKDAKRHEKRDAL